MTAEVALMTTGHRAAIAALTMALATASGAHAQGVAHTPIELGVGVGTVFSGYAGTFRGGDVRVTIPANEAGDVELLAGIPTAGTRHGLAGFYGVQFRHRLGDDETATVRPFVTYGGMGVIVGGPHPWVMPPFFGLIGAGVEQRLGSRLAFRVEAQGVAALVIPAGVRIAASVSMPLGAATR